MTDIIYSVNDSLFDAKSPEELKEKLLEYYTVDGYTPEVTIDGDIVHVHIDGDKIEGDRREFEWIAELCGRGRFGEAIPKLDALLRKHPRHSEAYRLKAQLLQQEGKIDEAIDVCIDALRCNPRNIWALMVMGNLFNQGKNDADTAEGYYKKVLEYFPDSAFAINNVASVYAQRGETEKAIPLYKRVIELEPDFENPYYGLAKISYDKGDYKAAFDMALEGCLKGVPRKENPQITGVLRQLMADCAERIINGTNFENIFLGIKDIIETEYHADIRLEADHTLKVYAQMQYGPTRGRRWHLLKYNPKLAFRSI